MKILSYALCFICLVASHGFAVTTEVLARHEKGVLEIQDGHPVLHLSGTAYEMGYQHGVLLKEQIWKNVQKYIYSAPKEAEERSGAFFQSLPQLMQHVSSEILDEILGLSEGSGVPFEDLLTLNLFPEMFHCSGITVNEKMTKNGLLYHVRVLDYSVGKGVQETAVLILAEPEGKIPFANLTYAGFIGSVTGMNQAQVAVGEIGGKGYGNWDGIPMAFLMRKVLEQAHNLEEAKAIFEKSPRTCEYFYVISDGKTNTSVGVYATADQIHFVEPGTAYAMWVNPSDASGPFYSNCRIRLSPYQTQVFDDQNQLMGIVHLQPPFCVLMTGFSNTAYYDLLVDRVLGYKGQIDEKSLMQIIRCPVARDSNLHNAIFLPAQHKIWVSHAGPNDEPACDQPYIEFDLTPKSQ